MRVSRHAEVSLQALDSRVAGGVKPILSRLASTPAPANSKAIEVCRLQWLLGTPSGSNGDSVVVIIRDGAVITSMLRRSYNQPLTPEALRVDLVESWVGESLISGRYRSDGSVF